MTLRLATVAACIGLALGGLACGSNDEQAPKAAPKPVGSFVGRVESSDAFIAVVTDGRRAVAYLCDGKLVGERLEGAVDGDRLQLASKRGARLTATVASGAISGSVRLKGGAPLGFEATAAKGEAGYYRAERTSAGLPVAAGWVVLANGEQRGSVRGSGDSCQAVANRRDRVGQRLCSRQEAIQRGGGNDPSDPCQIAAADPSDLIANRLCLDQKAKQAADAVVIGAPELKPGEGAAIAKAPGLDAVERVEQKVVVEEGVG